MSWISGYTRKKTGISQGKREFLDAVMEYKKTHKFITEREAEESVIKMQLINPRAYDLLVRKGKVE
jgi:hypothetical protein